jgi:hypothetical protein
MSQMGQSRRFGDVRVTSAYPRKPTFLGRVGMSQRCQGRTWPLLFNYFVGTREHCGSNFEAERLGGLEVND